MRKSTTKTKPLTADKRSTTEILENAIRVLGEQLESGAIPEPMYYANSILQLANAIGVLTNFGRGQA